MQITASVYNEKNYFRNDIICLGICDLFKVAVNNSYDIAPCQNVINRLVCRIHFKSAQSLCHKEARFMMRLLADQLL